MQQENGITGCAGKNMREQWAREQRAGDKSMLQAEGGEKEREKMAQHYGGGQVSMRYRWLPCWQLKDSVRGHARIQLSRWLEWKRKKRIGGGL